MGFGLLDIAAAIGLDLLGELLTRGQDLMDFGKEHRHQAAGAHAQTGQRYRQRSEKFATFGKPCQYRAQRESVESDVGAVGGSFLGVPGMGEQVAVHPQASQDQQGVAGGQQCAEGECLAAQADR